MRKDKLADERSGMRKGKKWNGYNRIELGRIALLKKRVKKTQRGRI